jgi:hypothetical protein
MMSEIPTPVELTTTEPLVQPKALTRAERANWKRLATTIYILYRMQVLPLHLVGPCLCSRQLRLYPQGLGMSSF